MRLISVLSFILILTSCGSHTVKTTEYSRAVQDAGPTGDELLLDVGVFLFDPGLDDLSKKDRETTDADVRVSETHYTAYMLAQTLQRTGNWGIVYMLPDQGIITDVRINGTILRSNGEEMWVDIRVSDSTGQGWYSKIYRETISQFSYEPSQRRSHDPFQVLYNNIANDLLLYVQEELSDNEITNVRSVSEMLFARSFSPDAFDEYLSQDRNDIYRLESLPADTDPLLTSIRTIRDRDYMFVDTVQDYYDTYARQLRVPYDSWRELAYDETMKIKKLDDAATRRKLVGVGTALAGAALAVNGGNYATQAAGAGLVGGGALLIKEGFNKSAEADFRVEALKELTESFANTAAPMTIAVSDRTIMLSGNIDEQYKQWREILADMYALETEGL